MPVHLLVGACVGVALSSCSQSTQPPPQPRPVRVTEIVDRSPAQIALAGDIRARYESKLGFRVAGKIVRRAVNVGDRVRAGQLVAELDPVDYRLATDALEAQLRAARSDHEFAVADLKRYRELVDEKLLAPAEYERRETSVSTLKDRVAALKAQHEQAQRQTQYTRLLADHDSVVVSLPAEVGQVVAAGQPVAVLAHLPELEVAADVPEGQQALIKRGSAVAVRFWAAPETVLEGRVREIAASAEPGARTYAIRIALLQRAAWVQIGMSATVVLGGETFTRHVIPLAALVAPHGGAAQETYVWALGADNTVYRIPVALRAPVGANEVLVSGLDSGMKIVTAGATRLREGEVVTVLAPSAIGGSLVSGTNRSASSIGQNAGTPLSAAALPDGRKSP
jgi:membrane fusion protein, multidrug efflux system